MDRVAIITGAGRGIGAATALLAASRGYAVCVNYLRNEAAARGVVDAITAAGGRAIAMQGDVSQEADIVKLFEAVDWELGTVTALVNNAGILERQMRVEAMDAERIRRVLDTNVVRRMSTNRGGKGGSIVNVSSGAARWGSPDEYIDYAASKGAVDSMTVGLSKEVAGEGIRVNAVRPGLVITDIHASGGEPGRVERMKGSVPLGRGGMPEEVAHAILWLLSDEASFVTGAFIDVSGGR
jgi:NAD(P)-dependent dehydrogenase (short-subunit alcohol dehydrogenase family)